jgi:flagellar assembly factor FliW
MYSTRFGPLEITPAQQWRCAEPLAGFEDLRDFALLHRAEQGPFLWLQSLEIAELAFLLVEARCFDLHYPALADGAAMALYVMVILPRSSAEVLRVHRLAPVLFDASQGTFRQHVFEPEQVSGSGTWGDALGSLAAAAAAADSRVVQLSGA